MSDASPTTSMEQIAEDAGFSLWQERAPQGSWFLETPHDGHVFFGGDVVSAQQARDAIAKLCRELVEARSLVKVEHGIAEEARTQLEKARSALAWLENLEPQIVESALEKFKVSLSDDYQKETTR